MDLLLGLAALFGAGVAGSLSPCVLPLVPGYLGVLADASDVRATRVRRVLLFCIAAVSTFVVLGSVVAALGSSVDLSARTAQRVAGALLLALAVLAALAASSRWAPSWRPVALLPGDARWRAVALGVGCGAAWSPCVGPLLGAALTAAGGSGSTLRGALLLAAFGAGIISPFVGVALLPDPRVPAQLRRAGQVVAQGTPWMLAGLGVLLLSGAYGTFVQRWLPGG